MRREDVEIDNPCEVSWESMAGAGMQRHCSHCDKDVVNLSMMTEAEAESFLEANHAPCIRYHLSEEGDILFQTALERQRRGAQTLLRTAAMVVPLVLGGAAVATSLQSTDADASVAPPDRTPRAEASAPDLVDVLRNGGESLSNALGRGYETGHWLASSAVGYVRDGANYLVDVVPEPQEPDAPKSPLDKRPYVMGMVAPDRID